MGGETGPMWAQWWPKDWPQSLATCSFVCCSHTSMPVANTPLVLLLSATCAFFPILQNHCLKAPSHQTCLFVFCFVLLLFCLVVPEILRSLLVHPALLQLSQSLSGFLRFPGVARP